MNDYRELVVIDLAAENAALRERLGLTESYRDALKQAIAELSARNTELEAARRRNAALVAEVRTLSGAVVS